MISKTLIREQLEYLPEEFTIDELIERLILIQKIEVGRQQSRDGEVISNEDLKKEIESWFE